MKTRLPNSVFSLVAVAVLGATLLASAWALVAAQNQLPSNRNVQVYPKRPEAQPVNNSNVTVAPARPIKPNDKTRTVRPISAYPVRGFFRVTLNGFTVNHESDDDVLEADGRGDEIFITANNWMINKDGTYQAFRQSKTKIMGDPNGHPERVPAGTRSSGLRLDSAPGGLQTGDVFPSRPPWRRVREIQADRPPVVLWNGYLTQGENAILILPIIWEWDSDDYSNCQQSFDRALPRRFEYQRPVLTSLITSAARTRLDVHSPVLNLVGILANYYAAVLGEEL
jgi:hypothetical protein